MKKSAILLAACALSAGAHAEIMAKKGARATLKVEYTFATAGKYFSPSKDQKLDWNVRRIVTVNTVYAAEAAQPFGALHSKDPDQQQDIQAMREKATSTHAKMQPTMNDMMKIVADCKEDEACISKRVSDYGNAMAVPADAKETAQAIDDMGKLHGTRFQLWRAVSQSASYNINEHIEKQVYEMTCTDAKVCKRTTDIQGGGTAPTPPGSSTGGGSMFEVDGLNKELVLMLPVPVMPLPTETKVTTTIPGDTSAGGKTFAKPFYANTKPVKVKLPASHLAVAGSITIPVEGKFNEGGQLTINWSLTAQ